MGAEHGPVEILVAAWHDPDAAERVLRELREAEHEHLISVVDAATLVLDDEGALRITETKDIGARRGAVLGGLVGAGVGLLTGGVGWLLLGGGAVGALAARARDRGVHDQRLVAIGEQLTPGSSALVAEVELTAVADLEQQLSEAGAAVVREALEEELAAELRDERIAAPRSENDVSVVATRIPTPQNPVDGDSDGETEERS